MLQNFVLKVPRLNWVVAKSIAIAAERAKQQESTAKEWPLL